MSYKNGTLIVLAFIVLYVGHTWTSEGIRQMVVRIEEICPTPVVTDAPTIAASGYYALGQDIMGPVTITADNVTLDLNGYTVTGNTAGIVNTGSLRNITVRNGFVRDSDNGVCFNSCENVLVEKVIVDTADIGVCLSLCNYCTIRNCEVSNGGQAFSLTDCAGCLLQGCVARESLVYGFSNQNGATNNMINCMVDGMSDPQAQSAGFYTAGGSGNVFSGCACKDLANSQADGVVSGFQLLDENSDVIRDCAIDNVSAPSGSAYGINLGDLLITVTQEAVVTGTTAYGSQIDDVSWSPDGSYLIGVGLKEDNPAIYVFSFSGTQLSAATIHSIVTSTMDAHPQVQWAPDGSAIAACSRTGGGPTGKLAVFPVSGGVPGLPTVVDIGAGVESVSWSPDSQYLAIAYNDGAGNADIQVYSYTSTPLTLVPIANDSWTGYEARSISFSHDGHYISVGACETVPGIGHMLTYEWQPGLSALFLLHDTELDADVYTVAWSPVEDRLACTSMIAGDGGVNLHVFFMRQNYLFEETSVTESMWIGADPVFNSRLIGWSPDGKYITLIHRYLLANAGNVCHYYTSVYSLSGNLLLTQNFSKDIEFQWTTAWHPDNNYFVTAGRFDTLDAFVDLYSVERGSGTGGSKCVVLNNDISRISGGTLGTALSGVATENAIIENSAYDNDQDYSIGVDNVVAGYGAEPGLLDNISVRG